MVTPNPTDADVLDREALDAEPLDADVTVVGYGPVGQTMAALLAKRGHRVTIVERHREIYPLPRAVRMDGEVLRVLQNLAVVPAISHELLPATNYTWFGADGDPIMEIEFPQHPSGWTDHLFHQPTLERELRIRVEREPSVLLLAGWDAIGLTCSTRATELTVTSDDGALRTIRSRYVVGADGANSFVRQAAGIGWQDLGFSELWLVVDLCPHDMADFAHLPVAAQFCDPRRPITVVGNGTRHRRWEFMLLPGEHPEDFAGVDRVWELLAPFARPEQAVLVRHAVYNFRSFIADALQADRVFLVGDAAHTMPPFMGEGMCSGIRDAANLAWKLDLVLRGAAGAALLDTYASERLPYVHHSVQLSIEMGKVSCELNPVAAAARDAAMRQGMAPPPPPPPPMSGLIRSGDALAGNLAVQGRLRIGDGRTVRADELLGDGFSLISRVGDPTTLLGAADLEWFASVHGSIATLDTSVDGHVTDADGALTGWLVANGVTAVLYRPDQYVFATAANESDIAGLVDALRAALET